MNGGPEPGGGPVGAGRSVVPSGVSARVRGDVRGDVSVGEGALRGGVDDDDVVDITEESVDGTADPSE